MNIRKEYDYSTLLAGIDQVIRAELSQMELYCELGRLICSRPERVLPLQLRPILPKSILIRQAFRHAMCAGCGIFTGCMKTPRNFWRRRCTSAGRRIW